MNLQKDDFLFADLKWVKGIEYLTSIVKSMLPDESILLVSYFNYLMIII